MPPTPVFPGARFASGSSTSPEAAVDIVFLKAAEADLLEAYILFEG
jgi:hypothetical protein